MAVLLVVLVLATTVACADLPLPSFIKPCARTDPNFNACAMEHARIAIPAMIKGDRKYRIPVLEPMHIQEIKVSEGPRQAGFTLTMRNITVTGLKDVEVKDVNFDFDKHHITEEFLLPRAEILGQYDISGRILVLPITGSGDINITMVNCAVKFSHNYTVSDDNHMVVTSPDTKVQPSRAYVELTNLFGGDKLLGHQMNVFINENWKDVFEQMSPTVAGAYGQVAVVLVNNIASLVKFDKLFPEHLP